MTAPAPLLRDIATLAAALDEARTQAESGAPLDLSGLEARAAELCAAAQRLPRAEAAPAVVHLQNLLDALDALGKALSAQHAALAAALAEAAEGRPDPHTARQRASALYRRAAAPDGSPGAASGSGPDRPAPPPQDTPS
ncbi:hypothetical protein [Azospirillum thermophilum]|uniref:Flagellar protein FlgN n=1 Tax=Azospirillum thermophilum TaxID=2202148 RepID=A0A2S2CJZ7_9PROT|nr:hypothetical protein [Azospirillum thermophilum]AWK84828.1 hypothetical protein DEW08_00245 [Azospirillum thermophilum]